MIPGHLLLAAYSRGWFPMGDDGHEISWYSPDPRGIIPLDEFHVPARLRRVIRQGVFRIAVNTAFDEVIHACAEAERDPSQGGTWITPEIVESYCALHRAGYAHSVEAWAADRLAGGLYGVALGGAFFGESMFHHVTDASKVALVALVERLRSRGYTLLDTQWVTNHLRQFGAREIPRGEYMQRLAGSLARDVSFV